MLSEASDLTLVERIREGDTEAFAALHDRYFSRIYRLAYMKTGSAEDAQDIASETFCRALASLPRFQFRRCESLYPWLHRIASNLIVDALRSRPAGGMISLDAALREDLGAFLEQLPDPTAPAHEIVERKEVQALVHEAIRQLPTDQCSAVCYRYLADLSIKEIARALDRSEGAVKSLLHRALVSLRRELKDRLTELGHRTARAVQSSEGTTKPGEAAAQRAVAETEVQNVIGI